VSGLPKGWQSARLGDLCEPSQYGYTAKAGTSGNIHFLRTTDITSGLIDWNSVPFCNVDEETRKKYFLHDGDVVISRAGSVGFSFLIRQPRPSVFASYLIRFRPRIDPDYFRHFLSTPSYWSAISEQSLGIALQNVNATNLSEIIVPVAPAAEQARIVAKLEELLSDLDAGVAELKAAQKKLTQYRQSQLKAAVEGALTAEWRAKNPPSETGAQLLQRILTERRARWEAKQLAKFKEQGKTPPKDWQKKYPEPVQPDTSGLPVLPLGWVWSSLDMLGDIASGVAKGGKAAAHIPMREVPYLRVANVQRGHLDLSEVKTILATQRDIEELSLKNGDVLFNEGGDRDKLGRGWVWRDEVRECIHQNHVFRVRLFLPDLQSELLSHHGNTFGKLWFQNAGKQTTNLASINMTMLKAFPVPLAPADEQLEILDRIRMQLDYLDQQERATDLAFKQSTAQRQNILRAAFAGQLVPQDPSDEPASALLERIRAERAARQTPKKTRLLKKEPA
jgi:type I restriction enzyme S subunit